VLARALRIAPLSFGKDALRLRHRARAREIVDVS